MATMNSIGANKPQEVAFGGTGASTLTDHGVLIGNSTNAVTATAEGATGQFLIGTTGAVASWFAAGDAGKVLTTNGVGSALTWETPTVGVVTSIGNGTNTTVGGTAAVPVVNLDAAITGMTSITMADTGSIQTTTTDTDTMLIQGYDVDGTAYVPFITITNANDPTCDLNTGVTIGTKYVYRADGTDVAIADGGTNSSSMTNTYGVNYFDGTSIVTTAVGTATHILTSNGVGVAPTFQAAGAGVTYCDDAEAIAGTVTDEAVAPSTLKAKLGTQTAHGVLVGEGTDTAIAALTVGTDGQVLLGSSAADPVFGTISSTGTIAFTPGAGTLALDCRAATDSLTGVVELATDAESIAGGAGSVAIIPTSLKAKLGTQTDGGLLVGSGTATAIEALSVGGVGTILTGVAGANPTWTTATYPATVAIGDVLVASAANVISVSTGGTTAGHLLTANGAGSAPTWQAAAGGGIGTLDSDSGSATGATVTISGGTNITTSGAAAAVTVTLDAALTALTSVTMADTGSIQTTTTDTDTMLIQGYDVDGTAYVPFITITNANDPTCDLNTGVTIGTKYVYRADGTDVPVSDGGTGASTFTDGGLLVGATAGPIEALAVGGVGTILTGVAGSNPTWTTATYPATVAIGDVLVASAANVIGVSTGGTTAGHLLTATGAGSAPTWQAAVVAAYCSDAEAIAGTVTDESVSPSTLKAKLGTQTSHGLPYGAATTGAIAWTAEPTDGQILIGDTGGVPSLGTITGEHGIEVTNAAGSISIGNLLTLNAQTGTSYTTVIGDQSKYVTMTNASASTLTIPKNDTVDYDIGSVIYVQQLGAGQVTLTPAADVTFRSADDAYKLVKQYSGAAIVKIAANTFSIFGDVEA